MAEKEKISAEVLQQQRLELAGIQMDSKELGKYIAEPDVMDWDTNPGTEAPRGYKRCGGCGAIKKLYMFNKNSGTKDGCTGTCKECQKKSARKSYQKTKKKRNYKKYYEENKEAKIAASKKYYAENKERLDAKHKEYLQTKKGKKVMQKARDKRMSALEANAGIPYTREMVIERDSYGGEYPICYLCGKPITDPKDIHLDHVIGVVIGGENGFNNVACTHSTCNLKKSKECTEVTTEMIQKIEDATDKYMQEHPDLFE